MKRELQFANGRRAKVRVPSSYLINLNSVK